MQYANALTFTCDTGMQEQKNANTFTCYVYIDHGFASYSCPQLYFEINCGTDNQCVDNLKVDFNFTRWVYNIKA